jgi:hypothetical protein
MEPLHLSEWGILLSLAIALGGSLYLGLLALSIFPLIPGTPDTFGPLGLLATPPVTILAAVFYLTAWGVRGHPSLEFMWEFANIGIRAIAVTLLALIALGGVESPLAWAAVLGAGAIGGFVQFLRVGWMLLDHHSDWVPARRWIQKLGGDTTAVGLLWLTLLYPFVGPQVAGIGLIAGIAMSHSAYRSGRFSLTLAGGFAREILGMSGWRGRADLPRWVLRAVHAYGTGEIPGHATPAALVWTHRASSFQDGWLVITGRGPVFFFRTLSRLWEVSLDGMTTGSVERSLHLNQISLRDAEGDLALLLPNGGPKVEEVGGAIA